MGCICQTRTNTGPQKGPFPGRGAYQVCQQDCKKTLSSPVSKAQDFTQMDT